ncbi:SDR family NAD(P)-dependent oxidoreductase [Ktedonobacter racemifer]|uniref:Short-chain dehydrogenase/reductase SDR n=1 Tax=Ktedonobacter racemifer DSM 44963 TaxID=485913 RepID=D6TNC1_KTERA|nr:SDR family NAD(P)-dependent oxidoreductase [Ktedonobacter racemifer]EFH87252.1 short-chain dehydrogenase/reductase SDR [Ktedonobacter racemifer DSM 44963]
MSSDTSNHPEATTQASDKTEQKNIVITGCSSGFGRLSALEMARRGWHVFATVRKTADQEDLLAEATRQGCASQFTVLFCDITDEQQVSTLAQQVQEHLGTHPHLHALLNNAGTAYGAPLEILPIQDLRAQIEVNAIAHLAVTQAFLPLLKLAHGTIINISSIAGRFSSPITGAYSASKYALEALSDALRFELRPFGVRVVLIEPASSPTDIWETSIERSRWLDSHKGGSYGKLINLFEKLAVRSSRKGFPPQLVADTVARILESEKPRARYVIPRSASALILARRLLPDSAWDFVLHRVLRW